MALIIHVDGGARGNPGPAGAGVVLRRDDGTLIHEGAYFLGRQTNNAAEYHGLIRALERALRCDDRPLAVHSDSELLVRQITGEYRVKSPKLEPLFRQAQLLLIKAGGWTIRHVRREENARADELANMAMDRRADCVVFDVDEGDPGGSQAGGVVEADEADGDGVSGAAEAGVAEMPEIRHPAPGRRIVRVSVSQPPREGRCPVGDAGLAEGVCVEHVMPAGLCVHAAHALLPTLLAMLNTEPEEFGAIPTLTVRCTNPECGAQFQLAPVRSGNGKGDERNDVTT